jgi:hypothetical protein
LPWWGCGSGKRGALNKKSGGHARFCFLVWNKEDPAGFQFLVCKQRRLSYQVERTQSGGKRIRKRLNPIAAFTGWRTWRRPE